MNFSCKTSKCCTNFFGWSHNYFLKSQNTNNHNQKKNLKYSGPIESYKEYEILHEGYLGGISHARYQNVAQIFLGGLIIIF